MRIAILNGLIAWLALGAVQALDLKPWPDADAGWRRHVVELMPQENEEELKVELVIGKTVETDGVNRYFFAGTLVTESIKGWGYSLYRLTDVGPMAGTLMAPGEPQQKVETFVSVRLEDSLVRYNSKLPIVVYVPDGYEVRYRIWTAGETQVAELK